MQHHIFFYMLQLSLLVPALGAHPSAQGHNLWWIILALVVFALVTPLAYLFGTHGGKPHVQGPMRHA